VISFVTWLWKPHPQYRSQFAATHVNVLASMVKRHYTQPHRFLCVTDIPKGIDLMKVEVVPAFNDFAHVPSPYGPHQPSCYRRLRAFHPEIGKVFGERFVSMDLDTVITGDLTPLFDRTEDVVLWEEQDKRSYYNGSLMLLKAGTRPQVWKNFNPKRSPREAKQAGRFGSDQGFISYVLGKGEATWGKADGVYSYRLDIDTNGGELPLDARVVNFHGGTDPWSPRAMKLDWVRRFYQ
jgi:hypothetical protein